MHVAENEVNGSHLEDVGISHTEDQPHPTKFGVNLFLPYAGMFSMTRQALDLTMHQRTTKLGATSVNAGKCESRMSSIAGNLSCPSRPLCPLLRRKGHNHYNLSQL